MDKKRELKDHYENIVVGAGIVGAGIIHELSKTSQTSLIIDKKKIMGQTSSRSSKMLHGGIRYLENFDFALVSEALREKNYWLKEAPHLAKEKEFFIPVYKDSPHSLFKLSLGVKFYDFLSFFKNSASNFYSKEQTLKMLPELKSDGLKGSVSYYDAIVDDKGLGEEIIQNALGEKIQLLENTFIKKIKKEDQKYVLELSNSSIVTAEKIIFATGPFTDQALKELDIPWEPKILYSKGSHLFIKKSAFKLDSPIVIQEKKRIIFLIPHDDFYLCGTTEVKLGRDIDLYDVKISQDETRYLIENVQDYFPNFKITEDDIIKTTAGIRPLVVPDGIKENTDAGKVSREHQMYSPRPNIFVIIGGKYTTFRVMAKDILDFISKKP